MITVLFLLTLLSGPALPAIPVTPFDIEMLPQSTKINGDQIKDHTVTDTQLSTSGVSAATYGDATHVPQLTVTAEGRVSAVTNVPITGGGTITGSGTTGKVAQWTGSTALGDGPVGADIVVVTGSYADPTWITSLAASKLTGAVSITHGGTGQTTASAGFDALSPMTTLGDVIYGGTSGTGTRLGGNTTSTKKFLRQTGTGSVSAAPAWDTIVAGDVPTLNQNTTGSAGTLNPGRTINGTAFDGSTNITVTADANTLTNTTLHSTVLASSLTSVGTLTGGATGTGFTIALGSSTVTGTVAPANGGFGLDVSGIAKGGLVVGSAAGTFAIKTVGSNGQVLTADSTVAGGVKWDAAGSGTVTGSGTFTLIPKWSSSTGLTDSIMSDSGSGTINVAGNVQIFPGKAYSWNVASGGPVQLKEAESGTTNFLQALSIDSQNQAVAITTGQTSAAETLFTTQATGTFNGSFASSAATIDMKATVSATPTSTIDITSDDTTVHGELDVTSSGLLTTNDTYWFGKTSAAATTKLIGINASDKVSIDGNALGAVFGSSIRERARTTAMGEWIDVAYAAGNFTASSGTWTVDAGDQVLYRYTLVGKTMTLAFYIQSSTVSGGQAQLRILIPGGFTANNSVFSGGLVYRDAGGSFVSSGNIFMSAGDTKVSMQPGALGVGTWTAATNTTEVRGYIVFEIQ